MTKRSTTNFLSCCLIQTFRPSGRCILKIMHWIFLFIYLFIYLFMTFWLLREGHRFDSYEAFLEFFILYTRLYQWPVKNYLSHVFTGLKIHHHISVISQTWNFFPCSTTGLRTSAMTVSTVISIPSKSMTSIQLPPMYPWAVERSGL